MQLMYRGYNVYRIAQREWKIFWKDEEITSVTGKWDVVEKTIDEYLDVP